MPDSTHVHANPSLLASAALHRCGVRHAFTTRRGGVSTGIFDSLNFGNPGDLPQDQRDPPSNIAANLHRVLAALDLRERELIQVHQVHGDGVRTVVPGRPAHDGPHDTRADAIVTTDPRRVLAIRTADCAPVLIASRDGRAVAAVHAGWRGVIAGVTAAAVRAMRALAPESCASGLVAAIGPCIGPGAFEVGREVAAEFERAFGPATPHIRRGERLTVDLPAALREQLRAAGLAEADIDLPAHCTHERADLFFSHRRDRGRTGRMVAVIAPSV